jgi:hypothetical protein
MPPMRLLPLTVLSVAAACAPPPLSEPASPAIAITYPQVEDAMAGCTVTVVEIGLEGFQMVAPPQDGANIDGQGHYHIVFEMGSDEGYQSCSESWCLIDLSPLHSPDDTGVAPRFDTTGQMTLRATLHQNDHTPLADDDGNAYESASIFVNYTPDACTLGMNGNAY